jgi:hypothetical protein
MARSKVVITSRVGVADDVIGRVDPDLVLSKADPEAMARVVRGLQEDRTELERLSRVGFELVAREFTVELWSRRVAEALRQCIPGAGTPRGESVADALASNETRDASKDGFDRHTTGADTR